jgi:alkyl hydroperoxide reductase subunit AhpC
MNFKKSIGTSIVLLAMAVGSSSAANLKIGKAAPDFNLSDIIGENHTLKQYRGKYVVLEWINHGCPFVKKQYTENNMQSLQKELVGEDVVWLSICSSAEGKQGYMTPKNWRAINSQKGGNATAILLDPTGKVGRKYGAKTTPHMFLIDPEGVLIYQGAIDNFRSFDDDLSQLDNYVKKALQEAMAGKSVSTPQTKPYGCSVKY